MSEGEVNPRDAQLRRRRWFVTAVTRWMSAALGLAALTLTSDRPGTRLLPGLLMVAAYAVFNAASQWRLRRHPDNRALKVTHDVVDALALGVVAAASGGSRSPVALILYPHAVAVSVRVSFNYSLVMGALDGSIMLALAWSTPGDPLGVVHALALMACAVMGGTASAHLRQVRAQLREANRELAATNRQLQAHAERLAALNEIANAVNLNLTIEDILAVAGDEARRLVPFDALSLALVSGDHPDVELVAAGHEPGRRRAAVPRRDLRWAFERPAAWCREGGLDPPPRFEELFEERGLLAFASLPLFSKDRAIGALNLGRRAAEPFSAPDLAVLEPVARHIAIAVANARLYEEARAHLAQVTRAHTRLEELDRQRQEYLRNVSHEFRTPLTVIKGYAEYLRDAGPGGADVRGVMRVVLESCERVIDMVDTLIEVNRVERGRAGGVLQVQELELRELAEAAVEPLRPAAERKGLALELQFPGEPLRLEGDPSLLQQVVRKLVDNAVKYSAPAGRVVVRARRCGDELELEVEDRGIGIAAEHLPRIFDKFYTVDGGLTRRAGGTGVGLYLVREIVRLHEGRVDVTSAPGQGSLFRVRVPGAPRDARPRAATA